MTEREASNREKARETERETERKTERERERERKRTHDRKRAKKEKHTTTQIVGVRVWMHVNQKSKHVLLLRGKWLQKESCTL